MTKYFVVICHPEPKSMCQSMGNTAIEALQTAGHEVQVTRIYEDNFDPMSTRKNFKSIKNDAYFKPQIEEMHATETNSFADDIEAEIQKLEWCDVLIFQFPLWWFALPAGLKGWVDRVFAMGRTYGSGRMYDTGVFKGKKAILSFTTGGPEAVYLADGMMGDINGVLRPIHRGVFEFVGMKVLKPNVCWGAAHGTDEDRKAHLAQWASRVVSLHEETPIVVGRY
jgi:NAD(P)H dehydrogenase (quinone)